MWILSFTVTVIFICGLARATELPENVNKCKYADSECIIVEGSKILHDPENKFSSLDPLPIKKWELSNGGGSSVNLKLILRNARLVGLKDFTVYKLSGFRENMEGRNEIRIKGEKFAIHGPYTMNGQILILPIQGNGQSNLTLMEPDITLKFTGKPLTKDGKDYFHTDDLQMSLKIKRLYTDFTNLYNGDQVLSKATNDFINENWKEIYQELKPSILKSIALVLQDAMNLSFSKIPYYDLFVH